LKEKEMKKTLLLLVAVVLAGMLILGCAQPTEIDGSSLSVNNYGVEPPQNVKVEAYTGAVLITWEAPKAGVNGYRILRQVKDSSDAPVLIDSVTNATSYVDARLTGPTKLTTGTYIYTVASYNTAGQGVGYATAEAEGKEVAVTVPALGSTLPLPAVPTLEVLSKIPASSATGNNTFDYALKISGINPAYTYALSVQYTTTPSVASSWVSGGSGGTIAPTLNANFDGTVYATGIQLTTSATLVYRLVATVGVNTSAPYNNNHNWVIADTVISPTTDSGITQVNMISLGTF
jgi:hypothetical protein